LCCIHSADIGNNDYFKDIIEGETNNKVIELPSSISFTSENMELLLDVMFMKKPAVLYGVLDLVKKDSTRMKWTIGSRVRYLDSSAINTIKQTQKYVQTMTVVYGIV
jgi:tRNA G10  N-methylase Trm11